MAASVDISAILYSTDRFHSTFQVISEDMGHKLDKVELEMLGSAKKVTVTKDDTILLDGGGNKMDLESRCSQLRDEIAAASSDYDRWVMFDTLAESLPSVTADGMYALVYTVEQCGRITLDLFSISNIPSLCDNLSTSSRD